MTFSCRVELDFECVLPNTKLLVNIQFPQNKLAGSQKARFLAQNQNTQGKTRYFENPYTD